MNKKDLHRMHSTVFWCLLVSLLFFWLDCITTVVKGVICISVGCRFLVAGGSSEFEVRRNGQC